jgi:hypothetical protein
VYVDVGGVFEVDGWSGTIGVYKGGGASSARTKAAGSPPRRRPAQVPSSLSTEQVVALFVPGQFLALHVRDAGLSHDGRENQSTQRSFHKRSFRTDQV